MSLEYPYPIANHNISVGNAARRVPQQRTMRERNNEFGYVHPQLNLQTREGDWYRSEFVNVYLLSKEVYDAGISRCSQWAK